MIEKAKRHELRPRYKTGMFLTLCIGTLLWSGGVSGAQDKLKTNLVDDETYRLLSGVWDFFGETGGFPQKFSWGESKIRDGSVAIDLKGNPPIIDAPNMGRLHVLSVERRSDHIFALKVEDAIGETDYRGTIRLEIDDPTHMVIYEEAMEPFRFFTWSGPKYKLKKVAGP